jgi:3-dehydroshikimate dehydratase
MLKLSAFADEISPDIDEQIRVCLRNSVTHIELRMVNKINVLDLDAALCREIRAKVADAGMGIVSIASPVGKSKIDEPWSAALERFKIAMERAAFFSAPMIRIFSYYPQGPDDDIHRHRDEVITRMRAKVELLKDSPVFLVHENEKGIYGERGADCLDILKTVDSPKLKAAFDFANFVQIGERPLENWKSLKDHVAHIHIKDFVARDERVVPAGQGDGQIEPVLIDAWRGGYRGFLSLEPHLKVAGHSHGETGPELFKVAADALKALCRNCGVTLAGD